MQETQLDMSLPTIVVQINQQGKVQITCNFPPDSIMGFGMLENGKDAYRALVQKSQNRIEPAPPGMQVPRNG